MPELKSSATGPFFIELQQVDSTNNYALELLSGKTAPKLPLRQEMLAHGTAIFAHEQSSGKGQYGRSWASGRGESILMSILVDTGKIRFSDQFHLSVCAAVSLFDFFSGYAGAGISIKWPNDLYAGNKKAGGILIENLVKQKNGQAEWPWSVAGFGININQQKFPDHLPGAVSLRQITGKDHDIIHMAKELQGIFLDNIEILMSDGFEKLYGRYLLHLYQLNKKVRLKKGNRVFEAHIKTVLPSGKLLVQHAIEEEFSVGEIDWLPF